jgi:putative glutamine amidotransferase
MSSGQGTRPLIGISTYREQARWLVWDRAADLLPADYSAAVALAGGAPVLLPIQDGEAAADIVAGLAGLVIAGGADVDPARYDAEPHQQTKGWRTDRDAWEFALLDAADAAGLPTLGICRGLQVMTAWSGGTLVQHVPEVVGSDIHSPGADRYGTVEVDVVAGTQLSGLIGDRVPVPCHHHQGVATFTRGVVSARSADGTIEAIEDPARPFWLGVQWHPETIEDQGLFRGFIAACRAG